MVDARSPELPPSLLGVTVRRAMVSGRLFLGYAIGILVFLSVILGVVSGATAFASGFPLFLPIFGVVGSMGGLTVFTSDRTKGVLEYLIAYGVTPRRLFANVLLATLTLVTLVLGVALGVGLGIYFARGHPFTETLLLALLVYALPMTYGCAAFAAVVGMYWTSLSSPREGLNSPIGVMPFIGILPAVATLGVFILLGVRGGLSPTNELIVALAAAASVGTVVLVLLSMVGRLLRRERLLSPA